MTAFKITLLLCLMPLAVNAGVYKWVDEDGRTHFGDRPPASAKPDEVKVDSAPVTMDSGTRSRQQKMTDYLEQRQEEREARQKTQAEAEAKAARKAELCRNLRARLKHLESVSTFYNLNDEGERVYVSEAENTRIREDFKKKVRETCGN